MLLDTYSFILFSWLILSWLIGFNIVNQYNQVVYSMISTLNKVVSPPLNFIRRYIPSFYGIDIAPFLLLILIHFVKYTIYYYAK
ncbi:YggT family protein [Candidatus Mesenet endosymbiont of Agriotes lineatus]|uniref:YggT family protein n=1 Tax=Candidatus Mesenet endosymbiont of Agriotes lineatus TaxID=3077948 RepID=UPI0030D5012B